MKRNLTIPVIILCGGRGSRFSKISESPKQLSLLNKKPLIIHIIDHFFKFGLNYFILPLGHKKKMFFNFFSSKRNKKKYRYSLINQNTKVSPVKKNILIFDAKKNSNKLQRILKSLKFFKQEKFIVTYGDGISNVDIKSLLKFSKNSECTITSFKSRSQYGHVVLGKNNVLKKFIEKPFLKEPINIGFYVFKKNIILKNSTKNIDLEDSLLPKLIKRTKIKSYLHKGYFYSVDNQKDLDQLKKIYGQK